MAVVNVQHDCHKGKCEAVGSRPIIIERDITTCVQRIVCHTDDTHFIVNTSSLHNYRLLLRLTASLPPPATFTVADRKLHHNTASAIVRDKKHQKSEARRLLQQATIMGQAVPIAIGAPAPPEEQLIDSSDSNAPPADEITLLYRSNPMLNNAEGSALLVLPNQTIIAPAMSTQSRTSTSRSALLARDSSSQGSATQPVKHRYPKKISRLPNVTRDASAVDAGPSSTIEARTVPKKRGRPRKAPTEQLQIATKDNLTTSSNVELEHETDHGDEVEDNRRRSKHRR